MILPRTLMALLLSLMIATGCAPETEPQKSSIPVSNHVEWSYDDVIYELNVRQFSEEGTFKAVEERLPELKELGVDIIWFMPIHPIGEKNRKGELGSYYAVRDYKAINPEFGTMEDFKRLVGKIHEQDMHVLIDWVANHTAWDHPWTETNPEFYTTDSLGNFVPPVEDWEDVIDLNYENEQMQAQMIDALEFWVREADIDGYRCDVAGMVPMSFWRDARIALDAIKPVFMLAEDEGPEMHDAFDMTYGWEFHHLMNAIARGEENATVLEEYLAKERTKFPEYAFRMNFTSNHDENSWNGTVFERLGDGAKAMAVLSFTFEGMPLIYNGQETGNEKRLEFFERDPIAWNPESDFRPFYKKLVNLHNTNQALLNGSAGAPVEVIEYDNSEAVFIFVREHQNNKVMTVLNLTDEAQEVSVQSYMVEGSYTELFSDELFELEKNQPFEATLEPWEYRVYVK